MKDIKGQDERTANCTVWSTWCVVTHFPSLIILWSKFYHYNT
jgi:hypothetical protein